MEVTHLYQIRQKLNLKPDEIALDKYIDDLQLDPEWFESDKIIFERLVTVESLEKRTGEHQHGFDVKYRLIVDESIETHFLSDVPKVGERGILMPNGRVMFNLPEGFSHSHSSDAFYNMFPDPPAYSLYSAISAPPPDPIRYKAFLKLAEELHTNGDSLPSGAFLFGKSFAGKTTSAMHFLIKWATFESFWYGLSSPEDRGKLRPCYTWLEASEFAELAKNKAKFGQTMEWISELVSVKFLIIDDLDKFQLSESVEVAFFDVLKRRIESRRGFTVITSNQSLEKFVRRFAYDRRLPIENRLRKFYRPFKFVAEK